MMVSWARKRSARPKVEELKNYCDVICSELDAFVEAKMGKRHRSVVVYDDLSAMIQIYVPDPGTKPPHSILKARIRHKH